MNEKEYQEAADALVLGAYVDDKQISEEELEELEGLMADQYMANEDGE